MCLFPVFVSETAVEAVQYFSQGYPLPPPLLSVTVVDVLGSAAEAPSIVLIVSVFPYGISELSVVLVGGFLGGDRYFCRAFLAFRQSRPILRRGCVVSMRSMWGLVRLPP